MWSTTNVSVVFQHHYADSVDTRWYNWMFQYKMPSSKYSHTHYKDDMALQPSYLGTGNSYIWKDGIFSRNGPYNLVYQWSCCIFFLKEAITGLVLEVAFPQSAIIQLQDYEAEINRAWFSALHDGRAYGCSYGGLEGGRFTAGSRAEGLAIEDGWGHEAVDHDRMQLYGGLIGVHVPLGHQLPGLAVLAYRSEGCPPAYCKIEVTNKRLLRGVGKWGNLLGAECIHRSEGVDWLHTSNMLKTIQYGNISGPASQYGLYEMIPTLVCSSGHPDLDQYYMQRPRHGWPSSHQLDVIKKLPMLLVLVGHRFSKECPFQARLSWSHSELLLILELPQRIKQVYIVVKYMLKFLMKLLRGAKAAGDGRSHVGSYHLKTVFLRYLEKRPPSMIRSQYGFMLALLQDLDDYLKAGKLPHYFLPDCDLLVTVGSRERQLARRVIKHILSDPIRTVLTCTTRPRDIYGEVQPDALVATFHQVSSQPNCPRSCEDLVQLLGRLDEWRQWWYRRQQLEDMGKSKWARVSGRPEPKVLLDMLKEIYPNRHWKYKLKLNHEMNKNKNYFICIYID